jgi:endonuclease/exonuclease/phosphatase family metal-dependent hydrolase
MTRKILFFFLLCSIAAGAQTEVPDSAHTVKIMTFNILHGATMHNTFDYDLIAKVIREVDPDFVALQEVDFKTKRSGGKDLATELGYRCHMTPLFARAIDFNGGEYGIGMLSKFAFLSTQNHPLPSSPNHEARTSLQISTRLPSGDTIQVVCTHIDQLPNGDRMRQVQTLNDLYAGNRYPTLLAGDFNDTPGSDAINLLESKWSYTYDKNHPEPTFPSNNPNKKIDYVVFLPANKWQVVDRQVIHNAEASDHCAYVVTLRLLQ